MNISPRQREQMLAFCGEIHEDDGVDPRQWFRSPRIRRKENHRTQRLCSQVGETIDLVLAGEFGDQLLHNLRVVRVTPCPDISRLLVTIHSDVPPDTATPDEILGRLEKVTGRLRSEVANAITRKRTPQLVFQIDRGETERAV